MKITALETFIVPPRWCFWKITTDEGVVGWGEPVLEGRAHSVAATVDELADYLTGEDPLQIERLWQTMYRGGFYRGGGIHMSAIAGIDQALWDIKGKYHDAPIHQLLGGQVRERIRVYAWVGGDRPSDIVNSAQRAIADGFKATKMNLTEELQIVDSISKIDAAVERIAHLREAVGSALDIALIFMVGCMAPWRRPLFTPLSLIRLYLSKSRYLASIWTPWQTCAAKPMFPLPPANLFSRFEFKELFTLGAADIIQPDLSHAGGITECKENCRHGGTWDIALAPTARWAPSHWLPVYR